MDREVLVQELKDRIVEKINAKGIVLFGSVARKTDKDDSDIDLLVIWDEEKELSNRERRMKLRKLLGYFDCPLDLLTYTTEELDKGLSEQRSFISQIVKEGKVIYGGLNRL